MPPRLSSLIPGPIRRRPQLGMAFLLGGIAVALGVAVVAAAMLEPQDSNPVIDQGVASTAVWTMSSVQGHVDRGEIVAISVDAPGGDGSPAGLLVKTTEGTIVHVSSDVAPSEALAGLRALGDGRFFTAAAWQALSAASDAPTSGGSSLLSMATLLVPLAVFGGLLLLWFRFSGRQTRGRDSSSNFQTIMPARPDSQKHGSSGAGRDRTDTAAAASSRERLVAFDDVAGCDEAKLELTETIEFLKTPDRFKRLGASIPRGILLYGPPGTGKTMLAKAVAAEAGVPFHYTSGSEFVEKYVGVGARRMRDLFNQAKKLGRGVIFVDEFDALGKSRGGANSHEEREQTLNQLLVEMDGFSTADDIVVIAATNRMDVLDQAVLRPGRFNRKIHVGLPDVVGRAAILAVHARNKPLDDDVDLGAVARKTYGFSGAQLADLLNEAAIFTARAGANRIGNDELHQGWLKVAVGTGRKRSMDDRERSIIAAHEVGHAICGRVHGDRRTVEEISLFAHGEALGVTVSSQEDNDLPSESDLRARLIALMGGRAAEELLFQEVTAGASNDFDKANYIATQMVTHWAMGTDPEAQDAGRSGRGALSLFVARPNGGLPSEVQPAATRAVRQILDESYETATQTLLAQMDKLRAISSFLVEHERIDGETFAALFDGSLEVVDAEREWRPASAHPREWNEIAQYVERRKTRAPWPAELERRSEPSPSGDAPAPAQPAGAPRAAVTPMPAHGPRVAFRRRARGLAHAALRRADAWLAGDGGATSSR